MKLLTPLKRVPDPYAKPRPMADGSAIDTSNLKFEINPFDEIAIEAAVRLREADPGIEIVAVSIGSESEDQLRKALAMGADRAVLVETSGYYDPLSIAKELQAVVERENPDVVLMGKQATDDDSNQVGQMLAGRLRWPQATFASKIELADGRLNVTRETDTGEELLSLPLPALVTADLRLAEPRYIALPGIIRARTKPLDRVAAVHKPDPKVRAVGFESPPPRVAGRKVGSVDELVAAIKATGVFG